MHSANTINVTDTIVSGDRELEQIAETALATARVLLETGTPAKVVHEECARVARGLGAGHVSLHCDYASLEITVSIDLNEVTRMTEVGPHGVNYQLAHAIRVLARRIERGELSATTALSEIDRLKQDTKRHAPWAVAAAVGLACASFGCLLGMDWVAFLPVFAGGALGQALRHALARRGTNSFMVVVCVAIVGSAIGGLGAEWLGSTTREIAMIASTLLLVPGVPLLNAQYDILDGYPTLGATRAIVVSMILLFIAMGVLLARALLGIQT